MCEPALFQKMLCLQNYVCKTHGKPDFKHNGRFQPDVSPLPAFASVQVPAPGQHKVSGAWGSVQEASALHALLGLLGPDGPAMEEAGLFWLEPAPLEAAYGLPPGSLPPMGASPDALLRHEALPPALHGAAPGLDRSPAAPAIGTADAPGRETLQGLAAGAGAGCAAGAARVWGPGVGFGPAACKGADGGAAGWGEGLRLPGGAAGVEPVEVKSTCPFQQRVRRSRKGHQTRVYAVADRGPMQHVRAAAYNDSQFAFTQQRCLICLEV